MRGHGAAREPRPALPSPAPLWCSARALRPDAPAGPSRPRRGECRPQEARWRRDGDPARATPVPGRSGTETSRRAWLRRRQRYRRAASTRRPTNASSSGQVHGPSSRAPPWNAARLCTASSGSPSIKISQATGEHRQRHATRGARRQRRESAVPSRSGRRPGRRDHAGEAAPRPARPAVKRRIRSIRSWAVTAWRITGHARGGARSGGRHPSEARGTSDVGTGTWRTAAMERSPPCDEPTSHRSANTRWPAPRRRMSRLGLRMRPYAR